MQSSYSRTCTHMCIVRWCQLACQMMIMSSLSMADMLHVGQVLSSVEENSGPSYLEWFCWQNLLPTLQLRVRLRRGYRHRACRAENRQRGHLLCAWCLPPRCLLFPAGRTGTDGGGHCRSPYRSSFTAACPPSRRSMHISRILRSV